MKEIIDRDEIKNILYKIKTDSSLILYWGCLRCEVQISNDYFHIKKERDLDIGEWDSSHFEIHGPLDEILKLELYDNKLHIYFKGKYHLDNYQMSINEFVCSMEQIRILDVEDFFAKNCNLS